MHLERFWDIPKTQAVFIIYALSFFLRYRFADQTCVLLCTHKSRRIHYFTSFKPPYITLYTMCFQRGQFAQEC